MRGPAARLLCAVLIVFMTAGCALQNGPEPQPAGGQAAETQQAAETGQTAETQQAAETGQAVDAGDTGSGYLRITQDEAKAMMAADDGHVIVDVRRQDEYDAGHIPGAVCIPNESIGSEMPEELPDPDQVILVYCRSGNRSRQASEKLAAMGYTRIYEFGGISSWTGEIVTTEEEREQEMRDMIADAIRPVPELVIKINGHTLYADLEDNPSADALTEKLSRGPLEVQLDDYGDFEKVGPLPYELPRSDEQITTVPGDVILYQGNQITIYYDENTWNFTRLARIGNATRESLLEIMGEGTVTAEFSIEWSE